MTRRKQLLTSDDAVQVKNQHTKACSDCPWARTAVPGWLGERSAEQWLEAARSEARIDCHTRKETRFTNWQCAGAAIFRANIAKLPRDARLLRLGSDRVRIFSNHEEFLAYHTREP